MENTADVTLEVTQIEEKRKMCVIAEIEKLTAIDGADRIVIANLKDKSWNVIVKKDEFIVGDKCVFLEVDSILKDGLETELKEELNFVNKQKNKAEHESEEKTKLMEEVERLKTFNTIPQFEFMRQRKFRVSTLKLRGIYSQGLIFDLNTVSEVLSILGKEISGEELKSYELETDLTDLLEVTKYEEPEGGANLGGKKRNYPAFLIETDEKRIENLRGKLHILKKYKYRKLQKLEGSSMTAYVRDGVFGVCSHHKEVDRPDFELDRDVNAFWKVAVKHNMEENMLEYSKNNNNMNFSLSMECIGPGIQGNIYKLKTYTCGVFLSFDIDKYRYHELGATEKLAEALDLPMAEIVEDNVELPETVEEIMLDADDAKITLGGAKKILTEGYIYVAMGEIESCDTVCRGNLNRISFKAKGRRYLLKHGG